MYFIMLPNLQILMLNIRIHAASNSKSVCTPCTILRLSLFFFPLSSSNEIFCYVMCAACGEYDLQQLNKI